jgi:hypothetical protein
MSSEVKTYILGMAKSPLKVDKGSYNGIADGFAKSIQSGPARSLELDFLRLVYAASTLRSKGHTVHAYLMVTTPQIVEMVDNWEKKYQAEGLVTVRHPELTKKEIDNLVSEKTKNRTANTPFSVNKETNARADQGRNLIEEKLVAYIEAKHGVGESIKKEKEMPFQVRWDYCRVMTGEVVVD